MTSRGDWKSNSRGFRGKFGRGRGNRQSASWDRHVPPQQPRHFPIICDTRYSQGRNDRLMINHGFPQNLSSTVDVPNPSVFEPEENGNHQNISVTQQSFFKLAKPVDLDSIPFLPTVASGKQRFEQDNPYFCQSCFKGYPARDGYIRHIQNHVQCNSEGCEFVGTPNVVEKHFSNLHLFNLKKSSVTSAERYRNERKRNFPAPTSFIDPRLTQNTAVSSRGTTVIEAETSDTTSFLHHTSPQCNIANGSTLLDEAKTDTTGFVQDKVKQLLQEAQLVSVSKRDLFPKRRRTAKTLLEELLHDEIEHERNVVLQCVRYVVDNNFFDPLMS